MSPIEFSEKAAPTARARRFTATAHETLFPRLLPQPVTKAGKPREQMAGQDCLFGEEGT
jgi:hypothetical protein